MLRAVGVVATLAVAVVVSVPLVSHVRTTTGPCVTGSVERDGYAQTQLGTCTTRERPRLPVGVAVAVAGLLAAGASLARPRRRRTALGVVGTAAAAWSAALAVAFGGIVERAWGTDADLGPTAATLSDATHWLLGAAAGIVAGVLTMLPALLPSMRSSGTWRR